MTHFSSVWNTAKHTAVSKGLKIIEHGWEQHVIIDETRSIVYRYPRNQNAANKLLDEVAVLKGLHTLRWDTSIPKIIEHHQQYSSYHYIPGDVLNHKTLSHLHPSDLDAIGNQLGIFLATLHAAPHKIVAAKKTKQAMSLLEYYQKRIEGNAKTPHFSRAKSRLDQLLSRFAASHEWVVVHGDLHGLNIVVHTNPGQLAGVIDFSEVELGDPHQDFRKLFMVNEKLLESALKNYQTVTSKRLDIETVRLWAYVNEWANMCHFSDQEGNETFKRALYHLKKWGEI
jgi:aminoglycoside phosphotransferase (APT) family kinase protein